VGISETRRRFNNADAIPIPTSRWKRSLAATAQLQRGNGIRPRSDHAEPSNPQIPESQPGSDGRSDAEKAQGDESSTKHPKRPHWQHNQVILLGLGLGRGEKDDDEPKIKESLGFQSKLLEQIQWLEMIDPKHRYGTNLKCIRCAVFSVIGHQI
jgi:hypothetical protein